MKCLFIICTVCSHTALFSLHVPKCRADDAQLICHCSDGGEAVVSVLRASLVFNKDLPFFAIFYFNMAYFRSWSLMNISRHTACKTQDLEFVLPC